MKSINNIIVFLRSYGLTVLRSYGLITLFIVNCQLSIVNCYSQDIWAERRAAEVGKSPFVSRIIEYKPAPGQFINQKNTGTPAAAESIVGGLNGLVSLGGFGGYIIVGFDETIWNDPENPYGVDFTIVGNATPNSSEPGIVKVKSKGDDKWYELKGSDHDKASTIRNYTITYKNPQSHEAADIPWTDNQGNSGTLKRVVAHGQPYYPLPDIFPEYPQDEVSFSGTLIKLDINNENPHFIRITPLDYGYADNYPFNGNIPPFPPDNPQTVGILEGNGGDAFDIDWAVDEEGKPVYLEGIDYIKIYTAVNANIGWLGEISTEIRGVIDISPNDILLSIPDLTNKPDVVVYPNPADDYVNIRFEERQVNRIEIWDTAGKLLYVNTNINSNLLTIPVSDYPYGIYMVVLYEGTRKIVKRMIK